jgi:hypothetical protein
MTPDEKDSELPPRPPKRPDPKLVGYLERANEDPDEARERKSIEEALKDPERRYEALRDAAGEEDAGPPPPGIIWLNGIEDRYLEDRQHWGDVDDLIAFARYAMSQFPSLQDYRG